MRAALSLLLLAGCSFPELAMAPEEPSGPAPLLAPVPPLVEEDEVPDADADAELESRANALRKRAAALPEDPIEPDTRRAMESVARP
jgi:hypothetical protein